jgi:hypothetical protein
MEWKGYGACCHSRSLDGEARLCPDCGHPLLRCRAFAECHCLVGPLEACAVHVAPRLALKKGAVLSLRVGDRLTLPLVFRNASGTGTELHLRKIHTLVPGREPEEMDPLWDTVHPGEEKSFSVDTGVLEAGGTSRVSPILALSASLGGIDEDYAFAAEILLRVRREEAHQIVQNIHVEGGHFAAGASAVVQTGPSVHQGFRSPEDSGRFEGVPGLALERAEAFELRQGLRGYPQDSLRIPRTAEVLCLGFPGEDAPAAGRPFMHQDRLACGRNSRRKHPDNPSPGDLAIRVYAGGSGVVDPGRTGRISGRHFELLLQNDRLVLRSLGRNGTWLNGEPLPPGRDAVLRPLDRIRALDPASGGPELAVSMVSQGTLVERIVLERRDPC